MKLKVLSRCQTCLLWLPSCWDQRLVMLRTKARSVLCVTFCLKAWDFNRKYVALPPSWPWTSTFIYLKLHEISMVRTELGWNDLWEPVPAVTLYDYSNFESVNPTFLWYVNIDFVHSEQVLRTITHLGTVSSQVSLLSIMNSKIESQWSPQSTEYKWATLGSKRQRNQWTSILIEIPYKNEMSFQGRLK